MRKLKVLLSALLLAVTTLAFAQDITVKGVVTDASTGEPLSGAAILVKGTPRGVVADENGHYTVTVPANGTLGFTTIGFKDLEFAVEGRTEINVKLEPDSEALEEIVVVAFGTSTKEAFTGSAKVVDSDKLAENQVSAVTDALAGQVAGVQLTSANGAPGATSTIRIRGFSSISAGQSPLIIVDGSPFAGDINNINPADIENMTVLKDAASNALYGARGANGVIIINTKQAKRGDAVVTFDMKIGGNSRAMKNYDVITNPNEYMEAHYTSLYNYYVDKFGYSSAQANEKINSVICGAAASGGLGYNIYDVPEGQRLLGLNGKINPNATIGHHVSAGGENYLVQPDNWDDYAYKVGLRQEYNLSVAASNEKANFFASVSYLDNQGITANSDQKRFSARLKADYQAKKWLKVGANFSYARYNVNSLDNNGDSNSTGNIWAFTSQLAPIYPLFLRNGDGSIKVDANGFQMMDYGSKKFNNKIGNAGYTRSFLGDANALMDAKLNTINSEGNAFSANAFADVIFTDWLKLTVKANTNLDEYRTTFVYNPYYGQFNSTGGTVSKEHARDLELNFQQLLNFNKTFGKHTVGALLGHENYVAKGYGLWASKSQMFSQKNKELSGAAVDGKSSGSSVSEYNNEGYFLRAQYDLSNRIFVSGSYRLDASSRFIPEKRWGHFWSVGAAWILSKENWFKASWVDELKIKASAGSQGNDNIGNYRYTDLYSIVNSDGSVATLFDTKGNPNITWETNTNINAGVEFEFLNSRLSGSLEYFDRRTKDMLFSFPVAPSLGYTSYYANVGNMKNNGLELDLHGTLIRTKNISWDINANLTWLNNRITMLDPQKKTTKAYDSKGNMVEGYQSGSFFIGEGIPLYSWYLREYAGVDPKTGESLWYKDVKDADGNRTGERTTTNQYAQADYYLSGSSTIAPVYGGFGTTFRAYGFDFSINFTYQLGGKQYDSGYAQFMASPAGGNNLGYNYHKDIYNSWSVDNPNSNVPRFQYGDTYSAGSSSRFLTDARYLNIQNINVGYTFPEKWTKKILMSSLRIYFAAENVAYWSARQGFDPRQGYSGATSVSAYSPMRTLSGGLTVKF